MVKYLSYPTLLLFVRQHIFRLSSALFLQINGPTCNKDNYAFVFS